MASRMVEAILREDGLLEFLEPVNLKGGTRVKVMVDETEIEKATEEGKASAPRTSWLALYGSRGTASKEEIDRLLDPMDYYEGRRSVDRGSSSGSEDEEDL